MKKNISHFNTPLATAKGLGSARDGTGAWWVQRILAIALLPLTVWCIICITHNAAYSSPKAVTEWLSNPFVALGLASMLLAIFYHAKLGLQVIIEDYIHSNAARVIALMLNLFFNIIMGIMSIMAIVKLHFFDPITLL